MRACLAGAWKSLAAASLVLVGGCEPDFAVSFYNNSGRDLQIVRSPGTPLAWPEGAYVAFSNIGSDVVNEEDNSLVFRVMDAEGLTYRFAVDRQRASRDPSVSRLAWIRPASRSETGEVVHQPRNACVHVRIEADMKLSWLSAQCGTRDLGSPMLDNQPAPFPVEPTVAALASDNF